jgi:hypothetical protein
MIAQKLLKTGILQLGLFVEAGQARPYRLRLELLSAYPQLMQQVVYRTVQALPEQSFNRLVAHSDCIPIVSAISLNTGVSLVYSHGHGEIPVHDLVGAYDVGHPACLIVNTWDESLKDFLADCCRVGLHIHTIVEIVGAGQVAEGIEMRPVYTMNAILHELRRNELIPDALSQSLENYLNQPH